MALVVDGDDRFDGAEFGVGEFVEFGGDVFDVESVGDPELGIDVTGLDDFDDLGEVGGKGVAGCEEGLLAPVEDGGMREGEIESGDADVNDAGGEASELEAGGHGLVRSGGVDDDRGKVAVGHFLEFGEVGAVPVELDPVFDAEVFGTEVEAGLNHVHDDDLDAGHELEELEAREADGAGTDDEDRFAGLGIPALDGVVADSEGLDEGELVVGKRVAGMELARGDDPVGLAESSGSVDADDLDAGAAVGRSFLGGAGVGIVDVGLERAFVTGLDVGDAFTDGDHFESEFVTRGAGVGEEGKFAEVAGEVGATDAHAMGADQCLSGAWCFGIRDVNGGDFFNVGEFDGKHWNGEWRGEKSELFRARFLHDGGENYHELRGFVEKGREHGFRNNVSLDEEAKPVVDLRGLCGWSFTLHSSLRSLLNYFQEGLPGGRGF